MVFLRKRHCHKTCALTCEIELWYSGWYSTKANNWANSFIFCLMIIQIYSKITEFFPQLKYFSMHNVNFCAMIIFHYITITCPKANSSSSESFFLQCFYTTIAFIHLCSYMKLMELTDYLGSIHLNRLCPFS